MDYKSNIAVISNIYICRNDDIENDPDFVRNCRGRMALEHLYKRLNGTKGIARLTRVQEQERLENQTCSYAARDGQMTHGLVKRGDTVVWECRCEYETCKRFPCEPNLIIHARNESPVAEKVAELAELHYEWLGTIEHIFEPPVEPLPEFVFSDIDEETFPPELMEPFLEPAPSGTDEKKLPSSLISVKPAAACRAYIALDEASAIVKADIYSRLLVNAGPGAGKTHTVAERLVHVINSGEVDLGQVLVLCYTKAAKEVVLKRLEEKGLAAEANQLVICTLDSLAWNNLMLTHEKEELLQLSFNGCIQRFNDEFDPEDWSDFEYVIIDELQDIVNDRAKMTLNILKALHCGYLLLGDKCQAIYDYDCAGVEKINSVAFYRFLEDLLPPDAIKYELIGNRRQSVELAACCDGLRQALLKCGDVEANSYFDAQIKAVPCLPFSPDNFTTFSSSATTAILTRNNVEAEWVSARLRQKNISHTLLRSIAPGVSLHRWLADMFWDYREPRIGEEDFIERYCARVLDDAQEAQQRYDAVLTLLSAEQADFFVVQELREALKFGRDIPPLLLNVPYESLVVSTIHKAKGREFDHVYLVSGFNPSSNDTEEARVWYVGATRPKSVLKKFKPPKVYAGKATPMNRRMEVHYKKYDRKYSYCNRLTVGLPEDVDVFGFIGANLVQALIRQEYIATQIKVNDSVELIRDFAKNIYRISHCETEIGYLDVEVTKDFWAAIDSTDNRSNIPPRLTEVYVNNVISVIPRRFPDGQDALFKDAQFWLGVELTGFAKAEWVPKTSQSYASCYDARGESDII